VKKGKRRRFSGGKVDGAGKREKVGATFDNGREKNIEVMAGRPRIGIKR